MGLGTKKGDRLEDFENIHDHHLEPFDLDHDHEAIFAHPLSPLPN